jgi:stage IV sporulation protein A
MKRYGITVGDNIKLDVRLVDCVGYLVNNAIGYLEDDMPRMVKTPWNTEEIPFEEAAEIGTRKVIREHSTIGILVTTDGSITDIPREDYIEPEERVVKELKELNKPFVIVLNSSEPESDYTRALAQRLEEKYEASVIPTNCENLTTEKIDEIFGKILYEFPIERINITFPKWVEGLPEDHWLKDELYDEIKETFMNIKILKQIDSRITLLQNTEVISNSLINEIQLGSGSVNITINLLDDLFYKILTEISGVEITNEGELFSSMISFANVKKSYDKVATALQEVNTKGYGIVSPSIDELILEEPEMVKQGSRYGVKLRAKAPSIHLIRADIETEVSPIVGSEKQSQELVESLLSEFENDPKKIWESNIFGKSLHELVNEGLQTKLMKMPEDAQEKLQETLERIINEGSGGLICIIL